MSGTRESLRSATKVQPSSVLASLEISFVTDGWDHSAADFISTPKHKIQTCGRPEAVAFATLSLMDVHPEPVESLNAVTLLTVAMAPAVHFYQTLGFHLLYGGLTAPFTSFRVGTSFINLQLDERRSGEDPIWGRLVFWVDDVDKMFQRAKAAGFPTATTPADASWGERYFHMRDPDGHELSFARPLTPA
jgi:catechol 2,3-dioxygenase-like lactoylglutathione lyase family enzyme